MKNLFKKIAILMHYFFLNILKFYFHIKIIFFRFCLMSIDLLNELKRRCEIFNPDYKKVKPIEVKINKKP